MGPSPGGAQYEFTEPQNAVFRELAGAMSTVGVLMIVFGCVGMLGGCGTSFSSKGLGGVSGLLQGIFSIIVGLWTRSAASSFERITTSQGQDISLLMSALSELKRIYSLQRTAYIVLIVLTVLAVAVAILATMFFVGAAAMSTGRR